MRTTRALALVLAALEGLAVSTARAESNPVAQQLFQAGQKLLSEGKIHEACEKLAGSYGLEAGLGTLMNLAVCHERENKTATAWTEFTEAAARAAHGGDREREQFARARAEALAKTLKKAVVHLDDATPGIGVKLDGRGLPGAALDTEVPIDPGPHTIEVSAPSRKTYSTTFATGEDHVTRVSVPVLAPSEVEPAPGQSPPSGATPISGETGSARPGATSAPPTAGFILGGIGLASLAGAGVFGVRALSLNGAATDEKNRSNRTPGDTADASQAQDDHDAAKTSQMIGFVMGGIGAVCLGAGAYLLLKASPAPTGAHAWLTPDFARDRAGLDVKGTW
jgi:hypothetical protein